MSFDPQLFDQQVFGAMGVNGIFDPAIFDGAMFDTGEEGVSAPAIVDDGSDSIGSKPRRKVRGPYSDPRIFEEYVKRCIAEREAPRQSVEIAVLKEALIDHVEERKLGGLGQDVLLRESQVIVRLVSLETARGAIAALQARQRQIEKQMQELEDEEARLVLALFNAMED